MTRMSGAEITIALLERQGITRIAGIPGGCNLPLYDALSRSKRIRHILARHEQGAGFIAQGMARAGGGVGVFFATSGPGATNALTALADARLDSVPVICITGQVPLGMIGTDAFQEVDMYGMSLPVAKHNYLVRAPEELLRVIPEAFRIAAGGRPGPVLIDIPKDVQAAVLDLPCLPEPGAPETPPEPDPARTAEAAERINRSRRPVLLLGGGAAFPEASRQALALAESFSIPVAVSLRGLGAVPHDHPLCLGMIGMHGTRHANLLLEECGLLIAAGCRLSDRSTGRLEGFCPRAELIHIDLDAGEVGKLRAPHTGIIADSGRALAAIAGRLSAQDRAPWLARAAELKARTPAFPGLNDPLTPYGIILCAASFLNESALITTDVGQHQMRTAQAYPFRRPGQWLTSAGLGTMGFGLPAAIGAALERPESTVVCFSGDGSLLMNIQELATAAEEGVNVKIIVSNNSGLGLVLQQQELFFGRRLFGSRYAGGTDFVRIAKAFGVPAVNLNTSRDPLRALEKALREPGPCLVDLAVAQGDNVFPMVPPGAANSQMIEGEAHA